jgi:predicted Zn finger-like uncharacterized protein
VTDSNLRYTFACPACASSFSLSIEKIPPVRARFTCPKCGKPMDFPSREEARVFIQSQGAAPEPAPASPSAPAPPPAPVPVPETPPSAPPGESRYVVDKRGFEGDSYDRRAIRILIRTGALDESDSVTLGDAAAVRAADIPELKSLFELAKTARAIPPPVCRKHVEILAHYVCGETGRPLCDECAAEKKFGGMSVRVCAHCGGTAKDLHGAPGDLS